MKVSYNWICELVDVDWSPEEMAHRLTLAGTACETVTPLAERFANMIVAETLSVDPVKGADKLKLAQVNTGSETLQIICGAPNVAVGQKVAFAKIGAKLPGGLTIQSVEKFGIQSDGMALSELELELSTDHSGIIVLHETARVGEPLADALEMNDFSLEFELTPNRPDSMSAIGIARDVAALAGVKVKRPKFAVAEGKQKTKDSLAVKIEDSEKCPRYAARIIKGVTVGPSPRWMKARLIACGVTPINNVVDVTNYVLMEFGQPLHAFDLSHFSAGEVVVKCASAKQKYVTLDEVEREIDENTLMITNGSEYLAVGGVMGGLKSSIIDDTKDVLLESAYFDPSSIRRSRVKLGLSTDASVRFERGVDPNGIVTAIDRAAQLIFELAGGEVLEGVVDNYPAPISDLQINVRPERVNKILGTDICADEVSSIFERLEFKVKNGKTLKVTVPTFRPDIEREIDLIEEVSRIYGLENIPTTDGYLAYADLGEAGATRDSAELFERLRQICLSTGYDEVMCSGLADERLLEALDPGKAHIQVANPISDEFSSMRNSLLYSLMASARTNITHQVTNIQLFEIGNIYGPNISGDFHERLTLGLLVSGKKESTWRTGSTALDYYTLKGALRAISHQAGISAVEISPSDSGAFSSGESFELSVSGNICGRLGKIRPEIAKKFDIKQPVAALEIDFQALLDGRKPDVSYTPIAKYPFSERDLSMLAPESVAVGEILEQIHNIGEGMIEKVDLFDIFRGKQVPKGQKSIAISIRYRSSKKSLESSEVDGLQQKIIDYLKREFKAEIRDH